MHPSPNQTNSTPKHVVIMGCGRVGLSVATALSEEGCSLYIMDTDPAAFELISQGKVDEGRIVPILGDGTLEKDLRKASTQDADVFIAASGSDVRNAMAAQIAKHIFQVPTVICRMGDPARKETYGQLGLITISSTKLVTDMVMEATGS